MKEEMTFTVEQVTIEQTKQYTGRLYRGPYDQTATFLEQLQRELAEKGIDCEPFNTMSVYFDDPSQKAPDELTSFHGVVVKGNRDELVDLGTYELAEGNYLRYRCTDPSVIWHAFEAVYTMAHKQGITLTEAPPMLISKFEEEQALFDYYFGIND